MLNHFIFLKIDKVNFPFFIFNSLSLLVNKVKRNKSLVPLHGVMIKLFYDREVTLSPKKILRVKVFVDGHLFKIGKSGFMESGEPSNSIRRRVEAEKEKFNFHPTSPKEDGKLSMNKTYGHVLEPFDPIFL